MINTPIKPLHLLNVFSICSINILRPIQNGRHFRDDISKCIFFKENIWILLKTSLKYIPKVHFNNVPALVQITAGANQATSHYLNQCWLVYWRIYTSLSPNELNHCTYWMCRPFPLNQVEPLEFEIPLHITFLSIFCGETQKPTTHRIGRWCSNTFSTTHHTSVNSSRPSDTYMRQWNTHHWYR